MSDRGHPDEDRWLDLVNGLLVEDDRRRALDHARDCAPCGERLRAFAATHERLRGREIPRSLRRPAQRRLLLAAAAAVIVVAGGTLLFLPPRGTPPVAPVSLPVPDPSILTRTLSDSLDDGSIARGLEAYARGDHAEARRTLAAARATGPLEQVRLLYLAGSRLEEGDARGAIRDLRRVDRSLVPEPWRGELDWSLAVALASVGEHASAESLRQGLADRPDEIGERARRGWAPPEAPR